MRTESKQKSSGNTSNKKRPYMVYEIMESGLSSFPFFFQDATAEEEGEFDEEEEDGEMA